MATSYSQHTSLDRTEARVAHFESGHDRLEELHVCIEAAPCGTFAEQLAAVEACHEQTHEEYKLDDQSTVLRRVFLSDVANQQALLDTSRLGSSKATSPFTTSVIEQAPLDGRRLSLWEYHVRSRTPLIKQRTAHGMAFERSGRSHIWTGGVVSHGAVGAFEQTEEVLMEYAKELAPSGANIRDHTVRTWFYVNDIDAEYAALVEARKRHFQNIGLTSDTHYIASTGIAGRDATSKHRIVLDAYSVTELAPSQVKYLSAPTYLGPTHLYGVTFERGTRVAYGDRAHVYISGTASIDPSGTTLHVGDVGRQCERALVNTEALLDDAGADLSDLVQVIAYVRDPADGQVVSNFLAHRCAKVPRVVVRAPVCRPNWLVEFECVALIAQSNPGFAEF